MVAALRIAAQHMEAIPRPDLAAFAAQCARAGLPEEAAMAASRAPEEITALVAMLQGAPDKVPLALEAAGVLRFLLPVVRCQSNRTSQGAGKAETSEF